jgi:spore coat protein U-like protein
MTARLRYATIAALFLASAPVALGCSLDLDSSTTTQWIGVDGRGYDVFDPTTLYQPLALSIRSVDGTCSFYATVASNASKGSDGLLYSGSDTLQFTVYRGANGGQPLSATAATTEADVLVGAVGAGGDKATFQVAYSIAPQQVVPPGDYTGEITVSLYEGKFGAGTLRAQHQIPLTVHVPSITELSLSQGAFNPEKKVETVAFGTLHQGDIRGLNLQARSNGGYRILLQSENGGAMRDTDPADDSTVPYECYVDGRLVKLSKSASDAVSSSTVTDPLGRSHRLDFRIGALGHATAGDYRDVVTVTVISLK